MAKRNRSSRRPQPRHKKQKKSQHDKRSRLQNPNPSRKRTTTAKIPLTGAMQTAVGALQAVVAPGAPLLIAVRDQPGIRKPLWLRLAVDCNPQHPAHVAPQPAGGFFVDVFDGRTRIHAGLEEDFVGVHIPESGDQTLIHEPALERSPSVRQQRRE